MPARTAIEIRLGGGEDPEQPFEASELELHLLASAFSPKGPVTRLRFMGLPLLTPAEAPR